MDAFSWLSMSEAADGVRDAGAEATRTDFIASSVDVGEDIFQNPFDISKRCFAFHATDSLTNNIFETSVKKLAPWMLTFSATMTTSLRNHRRRRSPVCTRATKRTCSQQIRACAVFMGAAFMLSGVTCRRELIAFKKTKTCTTTGGQKRCHCFALFSFEAPRIRN
jgi:hypothetical protein